MTAWSTELRGTGPSAENTQFRSSINNRQFLSPFLPQLGLPLRPVYSELPVMTGRPHVLVVDGEGDVREVIQLNLAREGYHIATAPDGQSALERLS